MPGTGEGFEGSSLWNFISWVSLATAIFVASILFFPPAERTLNSRLHKLRVFGENLFVFQRSKTSSVDLHGSFV